MDNIEDIISAVNSSNYKASDLKIEAKKAFDSVNIYLAFALKMNLHPMLILCLKRRAKECREEYIMTVGMREEIEKELTRANMYNMFDDKEACLESIKNASILLRWESHYHQTCINKFEQVAKDVKEERFKNRFHLLKLIC